MSQSTVSRALRGDPRVAPATVARVLEAAERLQYTPNIAARSLITRRTQTVGVLVTTITNPFYPELIEILHDEFAAANYGTILLNERWDGERGNRVADLVHGGAVDGLVYLSAILGRPLPGGAHDLPVVLLNRDVDTASVDAVVSDNAAGGELVAQVLFDLGHRRIAHIAGPENTWTGVERERGFRERLAALGAPLDERLRRVGQYSHRSGYHWSLDLLATDPRPTAIFAATDLTAFGALDAASRLGLRVPEDLSVVGFDDVDMAGWERFSLTTVAHRSHEMARAAAGLLLERIDAAEPAPPRKRVFPVSLVSRATHGPAPV
jgi:LacI family transcriptional regulator